MLKLLLLALGIWLVLVLLKHYRRSVDAPRATKAQQEDMVRCAECGVYMPRSASILKNGAYFCCEQHSDHAKQ